MQVEEGKAGVLRGAEQHFDLLLVKECGVAAGGLDEPRGQVEQVLGVEVGADELEVPRGKDSGVFCGLTY